jgi:shikimate kinase
MRLLLIGYRGTGKSTVAERLAAALGCDWVDADAELERRAGRSIAQFFADEGETAFRDLEGAVLADIVKQEHTVVALGGGVIERPENRDLLQTGGKVVWLTADPQTILARIAGDETSQKRRPNLTPVGGLEEIERLLQRRTPIYRQCAHLEVDTVDKDPDQVVAEILARLG